MSFQAARGEAERVIIVSTAGDAIVDRSTRDGSGSYGKLTFSTEGWAPGAYEAVLTTADDDELSRNSFWVQAPTAQPRIATTESVYSVNESIEVEWRSAPGNRWDWVGIYERGADPNVASYITWFYTDSSIEGTKVMDEEADGRWPLPAGRYSMYLLEDDGYRVLARHGFTVRS